MFLPLPSPPNLDSHLSTEIQSDKEQTYLVVIASLESQNTELLTRNKELLRANEAFLSQNP